MQYKDFIKKLAKEENLSAVDSQDIVRMVINQLASVLSSGEDVLLYGFGKFSVKTTKERMGRNPHSGETIVIPSHKKVTFKPSSTLKASVKN